MVGSPGDLNLPGWGAWKEECVIVWIVGDDAGGGFGVDPQIRCINANDRLTKNYVNAWESKNRCVWQRIDGIDHRRGNIHDAFNFQIELKIGASGSLVMYFHGQIVRPILQEGGRKAELN